MPPQLPVHAPPPKRPAHLIRWPAVTEDTVLDVQWRVWLGHQLRLWRRRNEVGPAMMMQKRASARSGLMNDVISRIEAGYRGCDAVELYRLALAYGRSGPDISALFDMPSEEAWSQICRRRFPVEPEDGVGAAEAERLDALLRRPPTTFMIVPRR